MAYPFSDDHDMIREAARGFLQDWYDGGKGPERIYKSGSTFDADAWKGFARDLGMAGVAIDEAHGGAGLGDLGLVVVMEELGASLCSIPFLTTGGIVAKLISKVGSQDIKDTYLSKVATGQLRVAYCDGHQAKDKKVFSVVNADCADMIFLSRAKDKILEITAIPVETTGFVITSKQTMDPTRSFCDLDWSTVQDADIKIIGQINEADLNDIVTQSFIALAAECVGGAQACLDMTLEYTGQRVQFGRTIASFQAIKHRVADMFILLEAARSAVYAAAIAPKEEKTEAALIAKAYATEAFYKIAGDAIQLHGGIGFTWEYPLHFFFKRARANKSMFGTAEDNYEVLASRLLGDVA